MTDTDSPGTPLDDLGKTANTPSPSAIGALFDNNPLPMFLAVNESAVEHYGYSRAQFLSMTIAAIRPQEDVTALLANVEKVTDRLDRAGVWRHLRQDGSLVYAEITSYPIDFHGRRAELVIAYDVSARIAAEAQPFTEFHRNSGSARMCQLSIEFLSKSR